MRKLWRVFIKVLYTRPICPVDKKWCAHYDSMCCTFDSTCLVLQDHNIKGE